MAEVRINEIPAGGTEEIHVLDDGIHVDVHLGVGPQGPAGEAGQDGVSPTVAVTGITGGHRIQIIDKAGMQTFDVLDGAEGQRGPAGAPGQDGAPGRDGQAGADGFSPTASVSKSGTTATITITDRTGTTTATVSGGADWDAESGEDGYVANRPVYIEGDEQVYIDDTLTCSMQGTTGIRYWGFEPEGTQYLIPLAMMYDESIEWTITIDGEQYHEYGYLDNGTMHIGGRDPGDPEVAEIGFGVMLAPYDDDHARMVILAVPADSEKTIQFSLSVSNKQLVVDPRYDLRADWDEADSSSFRYIRNKPSLIGDVQVNGSSVVQNGVANIPIGSTSQYGVYKVSNAYGTNVYNGCLQIMRASDASIKSGSGSGRPIVPDVQHAAAFYGLAKAAGDSTLSASSNPIGSYTEGAKSAISQMLGGAISISGTVISLTAKAGVRYICTMDVSELTFTPSATGICDVRFTSGSTATVLTVPSTVLWPDWFDPTALEANTTYEINVMDGVYGAVAIWS